MINDAKIRLQLHDVLFFLLLVISFYFTRNTLCTIMMLLFFGYTLACQLSRREKITLPFFCVSFLIFILYGAANIFLDNVISESYARTMVISLLFNLLMIYSIFQYVLLQKNIKRILYIVELSILTTTLIVILLSLGSLGSDRLAKETSINANVLAMLCVYGLILTLYLQKVNRLKKIPALIRLGIYLFSVLLSGSRKGLIMIVLSIFVIYLVGGTRKLIRGVLIGFGIAIVLYALIMNVEVLYNVIGHRVESLIILLTEGTTEEGSLNSRQKLIEIGLGYIEKKPWIGYGFDCFKLISNIGGSGNVSGSVVGYYSHNNYIELLFGGGIIGLVLYYIPMVSLLKKLLATLKKNICITYLLAIFVVKHVIEYAYVSYYSRIDAYILAVLLGCAVMVQNNAKKEEKEKKDIAARKEDQHGFH